MQSKVIFAMQCEDTHCRRIRVHKESVLIYILDLFVCLSTHKYYFYNTVFQDLEKKQLIYYNLL